MAARKKRHEPILRDCSHCNGDGTEDVNCEDCGDALYEDTAAEHEDELCLTCAAQRAQDKIDDAEMAAAVRAGQSSGKGGGA